MGVFKTAKEELFENSRSDLWHEIVSQASNDIRSLISW
jgi:hypothetical protein